MKLKVLQLLPKLSEGGLEKDTVELSKNLVKHGHEVIICAKSGSLNNLIKNIIKTIDINLGSKNILLILINILKIRSIIKKHKIEVVHSHSRIPGIVAYYASKGLKVKQIYTSHGVHSGKNRLKKWYNSLPLQNDKIICVSDFVKDHVSTEYPEVVDKLIVIKRGVDLSLFSQASTSTIKLSNMAKKIGLAKYETKVIFMPARITPIKGHMNILRAVNEVIKETSLDILLVFAGKIDKKKLYKKILKYAKSSNIEENIRLTDSVSDIQTAYAISNFTINASVVPEAFGKTIIESYAMGRPVIGSNLGAIKENIIEGKTGYLIDANNKSEIKEKIIKLLEMSDFDYNEMCQNCLEESKNFSIEKSTQQTIDVYNS